jgi:hypothetical protein
MLNDLQRFLRFAAAFNEFLTTTITVDDAKKRVLRMLEARDDNFLRIVRAAVFDYEKSPYLALCRHAGVEFGDVEQSVRRDGLEPTLHRLAQAGMFVTVEEFRGRAPIRRGRFELPVDASDFDNPLSTRHLDHQSGGSTGTARTLAFDLNLAVHTAPIEMLFLDATGLLNRPMGLFRTGLPSIAGFIKTLYQLRMGHFVEAWFSEKPMTYGPEEWRYSLFTWYSHLAADFRGKRLPLPRYTPLEDAIRVAQWLADKKAAGTPAVLDVVTSVGVRVARAALDSGMDISGSVFRVGSEPFTEGRAAIYRQAGVTVFPHYAMSDAGMVGLACARPEEIDEVHLLKHRIAAIQRPHRVAGSDLTVDAFAYTALTPSSSKVLINMESDDYGVLQRRSCGCGLCGLGLDTTLHTIRSYEKLTSAGVTFIGADLYALVESVLPSQFGGGASDYQLVEEEIDGLPRVSILISPRVGPVDHARVIEAVVAFLSARNAGHRMMAQVLKHGANLGVLRREPYVTPAMKIQPLHIIRSEQPVLVC